jgi:sugar/nucleoside kinase (ribokinase family)
MRIAGAGCCLMDLLYPDVDFSSPAFEALRSKVEGDGGLSPGRLVFADDAERFATRSSARASGPRPFSEILAEILGREPVPAAANVGGPSVVSLVHAAQMLEGEDAAVAFHGAVGDDETGRSIRAMLGRSPLDLSRLVTRAGLTPSTTVLSDPDWDGGRGERCFVNEIGAAESFTPEDLGEEFFEADIVALGGTALVPRLHEGLPSVLSRARSRGALTVVNTVFDFRAERRDPVGAWPLGGPGAGPGAGPRPAESYRSCDLLVMDRDEALRLSGRSELAEALDFFISSGVGAFAVSRGGDPVLAWAGGGRFAPLALRELPISERASLERARDRMRGDTTGCGDNFAGGIIAALALQLKAAAARGAEALDLADALSWGIAAGGFTLGVLGGTYYESRPGEKRELVASYRDDWLRQAGAR